MHLHNEPYQNVTRRKKYKVGFQPITHRYKHVIWQFEEMKKEGSLRKRFEKPKDLTILTCHNYDEKQYLEKSLDFLGIEGYKVLPAPNVKPGEWKTTYKLESIYDYLTKEEKGTPYVLYCDARDVIIRDDPMKIIQIFENKPCDLFFNSTMYKGGFMCMPEVFEWTKTVALKKGRYLNAGVFIGTWDFMKEVLHESLKFVVPWTLTTEEYNKTGRGTKTTGLCEKLSNFPEGSGDQDILRFLHPKFYPEMDIDYRNELVYRN